MSTTPNKADKKAEFIGRMIELLYSDKPLSNSERLEIYRYLSKEENAALRDAALYRYFSSSPQSAPSDGMKPDPDIATRKWMEVAWALGLNPDLNALDRAWRARAAAQPVRRLSWGRIAMRVAAVLVPAAILIGGYGWINGKSGTENTATMVATTPQTTTTFIATNTVEAPQNGIRQITLPDGTEVTLYNKAQFEYNDHREARLTGQAWFDVAKDPEHPFVIHSDKLTVTVLGTQFNFNTLNENGQSTLALYEGVVKLDYATGSQRLDTAGNEFVLDIESGRAQIHPFDNTNGKPEWMEAHAPTAGIMSLDRIFDLVETEYGVTITGREAVDLTREYNFKLDNVSIEGVMRALTYASGEFDYRMDGETITLENNK
jgi:ferric-dicitrate binding protein FerR (iron transport regulator)